MLFQWLLFFFVAFGAKLILGLVTIYLLLPSDRRCSQCDGETILIRPGRFGRVAAALSCGLLQWRWCPRCEWEGIARRIEPGSAGPTTTTTDLDAPTRRRPVP